MASYLVQIRETEIYEIELEADDEEHAKELAEAIIWDGDEKDKLEYHKDSDAEITVEDN